MFVKEFLKQSFFKKVSKGFLDIVRARGEKRCRDLCVWVGHNISLLFCFLLILERGSILRENQILARKSNFRIIPVYLYTSTEKQKVAWWSCLSFCFSVEVDSFKGKIRKVDFRGSIFFSRRIDPCSRMSRKQKRSEMLWPTHTQRSRHLFLPLALTMSKKPFETFLKNDCFKNSFTNIILCLKA